MPLENPAGSDIYLPERHYILWGYGKVLKGANSFIQNAGTNSSVYYYAQQSPAAFLDEVEISFLLKKGTYIIDVFGRSGPQSGGISYSLNGAQLGLIDKYSATAVQFNSRFIASANSGVQSFRAAVVDKNPMSSGFINQIGAIVINPVV